MIEPKPILTLFGKDYEVCCRITDDGVFQEYITTEHGELVASSTALWNAIARLEMLVEWMNEQGECKRFHPQDNQ